MAKKTEEKSLVSKPEAGMAASPAPAATLPARRGGKVAGRGFENLEREDILLPRLKLLQPLSPEVAEMGERAGTMFLNLHNKGIGDKVRVLPILHFRSRIKWNPKDDGGGIDCSSPDGRVPKDTKKYSTSCATCPHKEWDNSAEKKKDQQPKCTMYENFVILIDDSTEPIILPMERTKAGVAKKWYSMMALKGGDMFNATYELGVVKEKGPTDETYFNFAVKDLGQAGKPTEERVKFAEGLWEALHTQSITAKMDNPEDEAKEATSEAGKF